MDMFSFLAFGKDFVSWNYEKTKHPVYLHIKQTVKPVSEDRPSKKPTLLAIGIVGSFTFSCYFACKGDIGSTNSKSFDISDC